MLKLKDICERVAPVAPDMTVGDVIARFVTEPTLRRAPIVAQGTCPGFLSRDAVLHAAAVPGAHDRTIADLPLTPACRLEADQPVLAVSDILLSNGDVDPLGGFVVFEAGQYLGVGDGLTLLRALRAAPAPPRALLSGLRREIAGPLQGLLAVACLMQRQPLSLDGAGHLRTMIAAAQTSLAYLSDLTMHFGPTGLAPELSPEPVCLRTLLDEVDVLWQVQAALRGLRLITSCRMDAELRVCVDPSRFKQVLNTLVGEAFEASPAGVVEARLSAEIDGDRVRTQVQVRHTCTMLDDDTYGAAPEGAFEGAPLEAVLQALGGAVRRERNQGAGATATFDVSLPVARAASELNASANAHAGVLGHVLVVDDNATNRLVAEALCESFGFTCETAEDGAEAVEAVRLRAFDLVLMDIKMPGMNGLQATRAIRALSGPAAETPIVALTANADPEAVAGYLATGMCGVVVKPIKPEALFSAISAAIDGPNAGEAVAAVAA